MNKYKLNYLRFLTHGEMDDELLKTSFDHKFSEDGKFSFKAKVNIDTKNWRCCYGQNITS